MDRQILRTDDSMAAAVAMMDHTRTKGDGSQPGPHVVFVGGRASGVMMAVHLLTRHEPAFRVTIVEGRNMLGCAVAYSTTDPDHLLNTRVHNMSVFPDKPHHFLDWLAEQDNDRDATRQSFVSRTTYGAYLAGLLIPWSRPDEPSRLRCLKLTCERVEESPRGVVVYLNDGQTLTGELVILATGHRQPHSATGGTLDDPWQFLPAADRDSRIVIVGSGLSMVDQVLSILKSGHRGEILSISRRGSFRVRTS